MRFLKANEIMSHGSHNRLVLGYGKKLPCKNQRSVEKRSVERLASGFSAICGLKRNSNFPANFTRTRFFSGNRRTANFPDILRSFPIIFRDVPNVGRHNTPKGEIRREIRKNGRRGVGRVGKGRKNNFRFRICWTGLF